MPIGGIINYILRMDDRGFREATRSSGAALKAQDRIFRRLRARMLRARAAAIGFTRSIFNLRTAFVALAGGGAIGAAIRSATQFGAGLVEMSANVGTTADNLLLLQRALQADGISADQANTIFTRLNRSISEASFGIETYARLFRTAGVSIRTATGELRDTFDVFRDLIQNTRDLDSATRTNILAGLGGRQGARLGIVVARGLGAFDREIERQRELGTITDEQANRLKSLEQSYTDLANTVKTAVAVVFAEWGSDLETLNQRLVESVGPALQQFVGWLRAIAAAWDSVARAFYVAIGAIALAQLGSFVRGVAILSAGLLRAGTSAQFFGRSLRLAWTAFGPIAVAITAGVALFDIWRQRTDEQRIAFDELRRSIRDTATAVDFLDRAELRQRQSQLVEQVRGFVREIREQEEALRNVPAPLYGFSGAGGIGLSLVQGVLQSPIQARIDELTELRDEAISAHEAIRQELAIPFGERMGEQLERVAEGAAEATEEIATLASELQRIVDARPEQQIRQTAAAIANFVGIVNGDLTLSPVSLQFYESYATQLEQFATQIGQQVQIIESAGELSEGNIRRGQVQARLVEIQGQITANSVQGHAIVNATLETERERTRDALRRLTFTRSELRAFEASRRAAVEFQEQYAGLTIAAAEREKIEARIAAGYLREFQAQDTIAEAADRRSRRERADQEKLVALARRRERIAQRTSRVLVNGLEQAIFQARSLGQLLGNVARELAQIVFRAAVLEPLGAAISGAISGGINSAFGGSGSSGRGGSGGGGSGGSGSSVPSPDGSGLRLPIFDAREATRIVPTSVTLNLTANSGDPAAVRQLLDESVVVLQEAAADVAVAEVYKQNRRPSPISRRAY